MSTAHEQQYKPPRIDQRAFNCPHCGAFAHQYKYIAGGDHVDNHEDFVRQIFSDKSNYLQNKRSQEFTTSGILTAVVGTYLSRCHSCNDFSIWIFDKLVYPPMSDVPLPNPDLPDDVRLDYEEASAILGSSPRGAAALLRLGIQKLCKHLGESGTNLNGDISSLVEKGLNTQIRQALDSIRVIGNNAVHPGKIDLRDDQNTARSLFDLVNFIADSMISQPKQVSRIFENLPENEKRAIEKRDAR